MDRAIQIDNTMSRVRVGWHYSLSKLKHICKHLALSLRLTQRMQHMAAFVY